MLGLTILGNNSALPAFERHPTAQVLTFGQHLCLIDCGEGTQCQLSKYKIKRNRISHIFISHLHGDHYFGLPGLLTSMSLMGREEPLHVHAPAALQQILELQINASGSPLSYPFHFHANMVDGIIVNEPEFTVSAFSVKHKIECWGYLFREKKHLRKINNEKAQEHGVPLAQYHLLHRGENYIALDGSTILNEWVTYPNTNPKSYAYCADTIFDESLPEKVAGVDLLYHESTYLEEMTEMAGKRYHSTAYQAGVIGQKAQAKQLLIGHFSSKYECIEPFLHQAKKAFDNTHLAIEGVSFRL